MFKKIVKILVEKVQSTNLINTVANDGALKKKIVEKMIEDRKVHGLKLL